MVPREPCRARRHLRSCRGTCLGRGFTAPSDTLNIAGVGVGGMGRANLINLASQNIVALCDVDWGYADKVFERRRTPTFRR